MKFPKREVGNNNLFFKLKDGESKQGILRGEIHEFFRVWKDRKSEVVSSDTAGAKPGFRANIVVYEDGKFVAKIWEFSQTVCNLLADLNEEYDLSVTKIKISRRGSGLSDTEYSIIPIVKEPLTPKILKEIESVQMNILEHKPSAKNDGAFAPGSDDDIPF